MKKLVLNWTVILVNLEEEKRWLACCPQLKDCRSGGETREEAINNLKQEMKAILSKPSSHNLPYSYKAEVTSIPMEWDGKYSVEWG